MKSESEIDHAPPGEIVSRDVECMEMTWERCLSQGNGQTGVERMDCPMC